MRTSAERAAATADIIIKSCALYTRTEGDPFFFSSGWASPVFIDCKKIISSPDDRTLLVDLALESIAEKLTITSIDFIAGCELTGVPFATLIADRLQKSLVLARKQGKGFGRLSQFEGTFEVDDTALLVDDLATDGSSESTFHVALKKAEAQVAATFVLIDFDIFSTEHKMLSLATLKDIIKSAETHEYLGPRDLEEIYKFIDEPARWSRRKGGIASL